MGAVIGTGAAVLMAGGAFLLGHPDPSTLFGAFVGLAALSLIWQLRTDSRVFCRPRVLTLALVGVASVLVFWLQGRYWPKMLVLRDDTARGGDEYSGRMGLVFSPDGRRLLARHASVVHLWDCSDGRLVQHVNIARQACDAIAFTAEGGAFCVLRDVDSIVLWDVDRVAAVGRVDLEDWELLIDPQFKDFARPPYLQVTLDADRSKALLSRVDESFLRELDFITGTETRHQLRDVSPVLSMLWLPDRRFAVIGCIDGSVSLIELRGPKEAVRLLQVGKACHECVSDLLVSADGTQGWASDGLYDAVVWSVSRWDGFEQVARSHRILDAAGLSYDGTLLLTCDWAPLMRRMPRMQIIELRDGTTGRIIRRFLNHHCTLLDARARPLALAVSPDGMWAASSDQGGIVRVWRLPWQCP
jgi:WD40 repeat protein